MRRLWLLFASVLVLVVVLGVWQKVTAWEDRVHDGAGYRLLERRTNGDREVLYFGGDVPYAYRMHWNGAQLEFDIQGDGLLPRDWSYLPPYVRWFIGDL